MSLGGMVSFSQPCCWQASLGKAVWLNTRTRSAATGRPCPRATGGGGEGCGAGPICYPRSVCSPRNVTPYLLQRRHLWYCGFGVQEVGGGRPPLGLSWKWSTGPAEFERHKSPAQTGSGTRAYTGAFYHLLEMPQLRESGGPARFPRVLPQQPLLNSAGLPQPPDGITGRVWLPHLTPVLSHGAGGHRDPVSVSVCTPGPVQAASHGHPDTVT